MVKKIILLILFLFIINTMYCDNEGINYMKIDSFDVNKKDIRIYFNLNYNKDKKYSGDLKRIKFEASLNKEKISIDKFGEFNKNGSGINLLLLVDNNSNYLDKMLIIRLNNFLMSFSSKDDIYLSFNTNKDKPLKISSKSLIKSELLEKLNTNNQDLTKQYLKSIKILKKIKNEKRNIIIIISDGKSKLEDIDKINKKLNRSNIKTLIFDFNNNSKDLSSFKMFSTIEKSSYNNYDQEKISVKDFMEVKENIENIYFVDVKYKNLDKSANRLKLEILSQNNKLSDVVTIKNKLGFNYELIIYFLGGFALLLFLVHLIGLGIKSKSQKEISNEKIKKEIDIKEKARTIFIDDYEEIKKENGKSIKMIVINSDEDNFILFDGEIYEETILGKNSDCDLCLTGYQSVSRKHCKIINNGITLKVKDLNSTNGTKVNGVPIYTEYSLNSEDVITLGELNFRIIF